jgi:hypothetical protein
MASQNGSEYGTVPKMPDKSRNRVSGKALIVVEVMTPKFEPSPCASFRRLFHVT